MVLEEILGWLRGLGIGIVEILESVAILIVGLLLIRAAVRGLARVMARGGFPELQQELLLRTARVFLTIALVGLALTPLHINLTSLVVGLGVLGVVAGFAFQTALSNIAAGILIAASRAFDRGNRVLIANQEGVVEHLGMITTSLRTPDNRRVDVPNALVLNNPVVNFDTYDRRRVDVAFEVPLGQDIPSFLQAVRRDASALPKAPGEEDPPEVVLKGFSDKAVTVEIRAWAPKDQYEETRAALVDLLQKALGDQVKGIPRAY